MRLVWFNAVSIISTICLGGIAFSGELSSKYQDNAPDIVYLPLSEAVIKKYELDVIGIRNQWQIPQDEKLYYRVNDDEELDLSIYENPIFGAARTDGVIN